MQICPAVPSTRFSLFATKFKNLVQMCACADGQRWMECTLPSRLMAIQSADQVNNNCPSVWQPIYYILLYFIIIITTDTAAAAARHSTLSTGMTFFSKKGWLTVFIQVHPNGQAAAAVSLQPTNGFPAFTSPKGLPQMRSIAIFYHNVG